MILTKIAEKYLADWLVPVEPEQDDKALSLVALLNACALPAALPFILITIKLDSLIVAVAVLMLLPQLIVINLANTLIVAGKKRREHKIKATEFSVALLSTILMYIDLFILVGHLARTIK